MLSYKIKPWKHQLDAIDKAKHLSHLALFFEVGCVAATTKIKINRAGKAMEIPIHKLFRLFNDMPKGKERGWDNSITTYVRSYKEDEGFISLNEIDMVVKCGKKEVYTVGFEDGREITATDEHKFLTDKGFLELKDIQPGTKVMNDDLVRHKKTGNGRKKRKPYIMFNVGEYHPYARKEQRRRRINKYGEEIIYPQQYRIELHRAVYEACINDLTLEEYRSKTWEDSDIQYINPKKYHIHHKNHDHRDNRIENLECMSAKQHFKHHSNGYLNFKHGLPKFIRVKNIAYAGKQETYDICCKKPYDNYVANGLVVHNTGKTLTAINCLRHKYALHRKLLPTLVLCPPIVVKNWKSEFLANSNINPKTIVCLQGPQKKRLKAFREATASFKDVIAITNYEALVVMKELYQEFLDYGFECLVADESHKVKSMESKRTKATIRLADKTKYRYILSGTPILNNPLDIYAQFRVLDQGETFGDNFYIFRSKYFYDKNERRKGTAHYFPDYTLRKDMADELNKNIKRLSCVAKKSMCLDLPPLVKKEITFDLTPKQRKIYNSMKNDFVAYVEDKACVAEMAVTKALRLQQIASGFMVAEEDGGEGVIQQTIMSFKDNPRAKALEELLDEIAPYHKVIVWAVFKENYRVISKVCEKLKLGHVILTGEQSSKIKDENVDTFKNDPKCRVLIGHPGAGGIGINLTESSVAIFYSRNFSLEYDIQAEARNYRGGSERHESITRIDLVASDTIDEVVTKALAAKEEIGHRLLKERLEN